MTGKVIYIGYRSIPKGRTFYVWRVAGVLALTVLCAVAAAAIVAVSLP